MYLNKNKKVLFLTDIEHGNESFLQQETNIPLENMLIIQSYGTVISHPYGDIMRSIIIAIYKENVEEIYVVGTEEKGGFSNDIKDLLDSKGEPKKDKLQIVDYLFQNCMPEFVDYSLNEWLNEKENPVESVQKSADIIRHHPLVPSHVKVYGLMVNNHKSRDMLTHQKIMDN